VEPLVIGVLGGMGPEATVDLLQRIVLHTPAEDDADHLHILVDNNPRLPSRIRHLSGTGPSPAPALVAMARGLVSAGADFLAMPCNTAHFYYAEIQAAVPVPVLHIAEEAVAALRAARPEVRRVGLLGTTPTVSQGLYTGPLRRNGMSPLLPCSADQETVMGVIAAVKGGHKGTRERQALLGVARTLIASGAEALIAACTELPLILRRPRLGVPYLDATDTLARAAVRRAFSGETILAARAGD
jgi:aspartate racemase